MGYRSSNANRSQSWAVYNAVLSVRGNWGAVVITGELKSKVGRVWDAFGSGGISNPLEVMEQITYLLFVRRLDNLNILAEKKAHRSVQARLVSVVSCFAPDSKDNQ